MMDYEVTVYTGDFLSAHTFNDVYINLVGTDGRTKRSLLNGFTSFIGIKPHCIVSCPTSLGKLILIELQKECQSFFLNKAWFPAKVEVKSPEEKTYIFPIYEWITDSEVHRFREGTALTDREDTSSPGSSSREQELKQRDQEYCWYVYAEGLPHCIKEKNPFLLPWEVQFSFTKDKDFIYNAITGLFGLKLEKWVHWIQNWTSFDDIRHIDFKQTNISKYVQEYWKDDAFFGYQFLNGINPMMIQRCTTLPDNFPVTDDMVFLSGQGKLDDEMKRGNIFLCDYKCLDGLKGNIIHGKQQYVEAPLVLLHKRPNNELMPIAIQLKQTAGEDNPIFTPADSEYDWLTAKIFVRSADFNEHELSSHLLRTHLLAEVFAVSLLRNVPSVHPLYKLLIPHIRYTLQINILARGHLISEHGIFNEIGALTAEDLTTILKRAMSSVTYSSLCIPDDIKKRGLETVPNFYYREDGLQLWEIIHRFVHGVLSYYYKIDDNVEKDSELQKWIQDIFKHGFLSKAETGIPQRFTTVAELVKFVTMVIFTGSAQHAAVNSGQYDYDSWMPNTPTSLQCPPPTKKGTTSEDTMLQTFPDVNATIKGIATVWLLSKQSTDFVPLGHYPENRFIEETPCLQIKDFQGELDKLRVNIQNRNKSLKVPYTYLDPSSVENSVAL
ncbi:arachidonate 12-lipoxygenase, 12R-type-like [Micropterus salmoides]|uniref:arachidonate 12-lipoxygenase, 12R-type-like n=1 Tax=Micropterus salmoides TaxID=27706 RepID=UPI0018EDE2B9|nr:arachidonate 12-lipoxygenase, 12R-type-like [Micropterus salmoides]